MTKMAQEQQAEKKIQNRANSENERLKRKAHGRKDRRTEEEVEREKEVLGELKGCLFCSFLLCGGFILFMFFYCHLNLNFPGDCIHESLIDLCP